MTSRTDRIAASTILPSGEYAALLIDRAGRFLVWVAQVVPAAERHGPAIRRAVESGYFEELVLLGPGPNVGDGAIVSRTPAHYDVDVAATLGAHPLAIDHGAGWALSLEDTQALAGFAQDAQEVDA